MIPNTKFVFKESFKATWIILAHIIEYIKWFYMPTKWKVFAFCGQISCYNGCLLWSNDWYETSHVILHNPKENNIKTMLIFFGIMYSISQSREKELLLWNYTLPDLLTIMSLTASIADIYIDTMIDREKKTNLWSA